MRLPETKKASLIVFIMFGVSVLLMALVFLYFGLVPNDSTTVNNDKYILTLNGPWKFNPGDDPQWAQPNFNDSGWKTADFTAPPGARDDDVGISGYIPGWSSKGYSKLSGYAWYRMKVPLDQFEGKNLALLAPSAVDDVYQLFVDGVLLGSSADFASAVPTIYSIKPGMFPLPKSTNKENNLTIAFRVWMSPSRVGQPESGGIHVAPAIGEKDHIATKYQFQWHQTIKGYIVEVVIPLIFILLAITMLMLRRMKMLSHSCKWFVVGLVLLALVRTNQAVYFWFDIESAHLFSIVTTVLIIPLIPGSWVMAWWEWFDLPKPKWILNIVTLLTVIYLVCQLFKLSWIFDSFNHAFFQKVVDYIRLSFILLILFTIYLAIRKSGLKDWISLLAILLVSIGIFAKEVSDLNLIPGIWFPYGVGVSRSQYAYAVFALVMYIILIKKTNRVTSPS
jgi:hypothetical protein